jgi:hypothetical protein
VFRSRRPICKQRVERVAVPIALVSIEANSGIRVDSFSLFPTDVQNSPVASVFDFILK